MNKSEKVRLYYGIFLSVLTVAVGLVFIITIANFYYSAKEQGISPIYTVDGLKEVLTLPLVFLFTWVAAIIGGFVLSVIFPTKENRKPYSNDKKILAMLKNRIPSQGSKEGFDEAKAKIRKIEISKIIVWAVTLAVLAVSSVIIMLYVFDPSHFSTEFLKDILELVRNIIIWVGASIVVSIGAVIYDSIATKQELNYVKKAIATGDKNTVEKKETKKNLVVFMTVALAALFLFAIALYVAAPSIIHKMINANLTALKFGIIACLILGLIVAGVVMATVARKYVPEKADKIIVLCSRIAVGVIAVAFIIAGITNGGAAAVLTKAINICTECIGLG